jgi:hypothetical protein
MQWSKDNKIYYHKLFLQKINQLIESIIQKVKKKKKVDTETLKIK